MIDKIAPPIPRKCSFPSGTDLFKSLTIKLSNLFDEVPKFSSVASFSLELSNFCLTGLVSLTGLKLSLTGLLFFIFFAEVFSVTET
jgi:hypothetical protein